MRSPARHNKTISDRVRSPWDLLPAQRMLATISSASSRRIAARPRRGSGNAGRTANGAGKLRDGRIRW